ncbi:MAG: TIR domain-containing protein [Acidobacteriota bacterium]|nr:TIR domain-containing protein [Acidobacteriota bacterium]
MDDDNSIRDFFISYNKADFDWAEWVAWGLEEEGYTTILQDWDFRPGQSFVLRMDQAAQQADRTIAILSADYLNASYTQPEWAAAFARDPAGDKGLLIPVRVRECELQGLLSPIIYIDLIGLEEQAAKATLLAGVQRGRAKPKRRPTFPAAVPRSVAARPKFPGRGRPQYVKWLLLISIVAALTLLTFTFRDRLSGPRAVGTSPAGGASAPAPTAGRKHQLSVARWVGYAPFYIARDKGWMPHWDFFDRTNMTVEERAEHINSKKDYAFVSTFDNFFNDVAAGSQYNVKATVILVLAESVGGDAIVARDSIRRVKDLRGKKVGAWVGSTAHLFLTEELSAEHMGLSDVDFKPISRPEQLVESFAHGDLDSIATYSPYVERAEQYGHILRSSADLKAPLIFDALLLHEQPSAELDRDAIIELMSAWDKGVLLLRQRNDESFDELASVLGVSAPQARQAYSRVRLFTVLENETRVDDWATICERVRGFSQQAGLWHQGTTSALRLDKRYAEEYLKQE